jgi:nucleoside phosphorylase
VRAKYTNNHGWLPHTHNRWNSARALQISIDAFGEGHKETAFLRLILQISGVNRTVFHQPDEILAIAESRGLRRALMVTALPIEMRAVRAHINDIGSAVGRSGTVYECGQFAADGSEWLIVVAESGAGNNAAQGVVTYALTDFGDFETLMFVGVAGSRKSDAPIGSVIAASHVYNPYSGKYHPGGFSSRPHSIPIDNRLVQLSRKVSRDEAWHNRIVPPLKGALPELENYPKPYPPASIVAPIVAVEAVAADPESELERMIAQVGGDAHAVEMEGYGAVFAAGLERIPCIVVRGISDMTAEKTPEGDAVRQPVAAVHAAAFGFELLNLWGQANRPSTPPPNPSTPANGQQPTANSSSLGSSSGENSTSSSPTSVTTLPSSTNILVLNFSGTEWDFPPEKIDSIVEFLRKATGNPDLSFAGSEPGSFRLFIDGKLEDVASINADAVRNTLAGQYNAKLLGVVGWTHYQEAKAFEVQLRSASEVLLNWPRKLPDGTWIDRPEIAQILGRIDEGDSSTTVLLGAPGSGKSALVATLVQDLIKRGWPILAIKADLLDSEIATEHDLQAYLGLSELPSVALEHVAALRPVVLLIDQLDALATYLDLRTGRLSVLLNLVRRLSGHRNVHIVLSARTFEFEHDVRLRSITAESIHLGLPAWHTILPVLEERGIRAAGWPTDVQEVLRSPQALSIFLQLNQQNSGEPFATYQAMLDRLWSERVLQRPNGPRLARLASDVAHAMAEEETLWLATVRFEDRIDDLRTLAGMGILTTLQSEGAVGFSHQTLFDHALARDFARGHGRLSTFVLNRQASLFVRPKLWAALTYLRAVEPSTYETELEAIWRATDLRRQLRLLLIDFIGQQTTPSDREAVLMEQTLNDPTDRQFGFRALAGSPGWFDRIAYTFVADAMSEGQASANLAITVLEPAWRFASDKVISLIESLWANRPPLDLFSWMVLESCPTWSEDVLGIAEKILKRSDIPSFRVDHLISTVGVDQPDTAVRLLRAKLNRDLAVAEVEADKLKSLQRPETEDTGTLIAWEFANSPSKPITKVIEESREWDSLSSLADTAPEAVLRELWPWFQTALEALRATEERHDDSLRFALPYKLDFRFEDEHGLDLPEPSLLEGLRIAAEKLAAAQPDRFLEWLDINEAENAVPAQRLFAHVLATQPERFAPRALSFFLSDNRRFLLGSSENYFGTSKRLVQAVAPFWSDAELQRFVDAILSYNPDPQNGLTDAKSRQQFIRQIRRVRLGLLEVLPRERLASSVRRLITEEERVFPESRLGATFSGPRYIGSPMEAQAMHRASNEDIIKAFGELPDSTGWDHPKRWMAGGNIQLSRAFADFAKADPGRAIGIIHAFTPGVGERAAGYALDAMAESSDVELVTNLFLDLARREFDSEEFRVSAARAIERLVQRNVAVDDNVLAVLEGWLVRTNRPQEEMIEEEEEESESEVTRLDSEQTVEDRSSDEAPRSVIWDSFVGSVLPHGNYPVLETIARVLLSRPDHDRLIRVLSDHLDRSENPKVWQSLLHFFAYLQPKDHSDLSEFLSDLFTKYPQVGRSREAAMLLGSVHWRAPELVRGILKDWAGARDQDLQQAYGELATLIAVVQPDLQWAKNELKRIVETPGMRHARIGAAFSSIHLWSDRARRSAATEVLIALMPDADRQLWAAILDLFRIIDELTPESNTIKLLEGIAQYIEAIGRVNATFIVDRLQTLLPHQALLVARIAQGLVSNWRSELGDPRTATSMAAPQLVDLAITLHRLGPSTRDIGTKLFEDLLLIDAYSARRTLVEIDNRFATHLYPARPRLPRRRSRTSRRATA